LVSPRMRSLIAHAALAQVLQAAGKPEAALAEAEIGLAGITRITGERSARHAEGLVLVATILLDLDRPREADAKLARACEIQAFAVGDKSATLAECYMQRAIALSALGKNRDALGFAEKVLAIVRATFADDHPQVATAYITRGALHAELGEHAAAVADLERAVAGFSKQPRALDIGHLAAAEWGLGRELYALGQRARGRALVEQAVERFAGAAAAWQEARGEATAWLRTHR
jgi:tetratricopeptide (TPR) repeat protein